jgi:hypothetical protein
MAISRAKIDILDILTKKKVSLTLNEIKQELRLSIQPKMLLRELNDIVNTIKTSKRRILLKLVAKDSVY